MKIYLTHSSEFNYKEYIYSPIKSCSKLWNNHDIFLPHDKNPLGTFSKLIIKNADLVIAEVSLPSTGLGIELGWANLYNKEVICFYKQSHRPSSALEFISNKIVEYTDVNDFIEKILSHTELNRV